ncbi:hypothetical protein WR25_18906 [Diploscapter pachys]|uniref:PDZ domain-containing protein n=1 Tax=Diploscapter pachys TaxID=2018661 RepID=A0A2A2KHK0_9BILA|nr:hypothetical protein WR25_18906 [Diploscapter pachys]
MSTSNGSNGTSSPSVSNQTPQPTPPPQQMGNPQIAGNEYANPFQMYPMMPPFFGNPFMSPFMPQQAATSPDGIQPSQTPVNPQTNQAAMPAFLTPAQYQEMMQQYLQHMMAASQMQQFPMPFAPMMPPFAQAAAPQSVDVSLTPSPTKSELINEQQNRQSADNSDYGEKRNEHLNDEQHNNHEQLQNGNSREGSLQKDDTRQSKSDDEAQLSNGMEQKDASPKSDTEEKGKDRRKSVDEEKTTSLIKKQMNEIDKEISRRSQNKNIKTIADEELEELMGAVPSAQVQSGLPYTPPPLAQQAVVTKKETLDQLRSSFNLPETSTPSLAPQITPQPMPSQAMVQPISIAPAPTFAQAPTMPFVPVAAQPQATAAFTPEQLAVLAQQQLTMAAAASNFPTGFSPIPPPPSNQVPFPPFLMHSPASTSSATGLAPPPPPAHPVNRKNSNGSSTNKSDWPEENKENGTTDDAVWVMRESYLKRLQREQQEEPCWQDAANAAQAEAGIDDEERAETDTLLVDGDKTDKQQAADGKKRNSKETMVHEPAVLIEGVLFRAKYLGSTQMVVEGRSSKTSRMGQAQEAVARVKAPDGEIQPSTEIDLFISTEKIMVLNTDLQRISDTDVRQDILMDHALRTISYIADIGDIVVLMARRMSSSQSADDPNQSPDGLGKTPKVICHVFESDEASFIAQSIGQAFQVAYVEFLRANGIDDPSYLRQIDYQEVLNSQELTGDELEMFARKETQKDVVVPKKTGEPLGIVVVESGWGSMLPTVVLAHMNPAGPAAHCSKLNIGDQIISINGISLVGLPLSTAQTHIKNTKSATAVRLTVVSTPPVVEVRIRRPDTKYQLGFSVQNGVICSLLRGGIAERGGIRVGHRIIEINNQSVVAVAHDRIVNMLATAVGEIHMRTMPTSMFRLLTGQEVPQYI